ncbi:MAG: Mut7-C RNAse domain-containing protein [Dehalococcoidales bacterium]
MHVLENYFFSTDERRLFRHSQYVECPNCRRIYWQGTHWQAMLKKLEGLANS